MARGGTRSGECYHRAARCSLKWQREDTPARLPGIIKTCTAPAASRRLEIRVFCEHARTDLDQPGPVFTRLALSQRQPAPARSGLIQIERPTADAADTSAKLTSRPASMRMSLLVTDTFAIMADGCSRSNLWIFVQEQWDGKHCNAERIMYNVVFR